jgi:Xaa-Pro aminopeptidase
MSIQDFGGNFQLSKLYRAQEWAKEITYKISSEIKAGMIEDEAQDIYKKICLESGIEKNWHPPKIRFGPNTQKSFYETSDPYILKEEDIFFIDIGPVLEGHEADYGETFWLGNDYEMRKLAESSKIIFGLTRQFWLEKKPTGPEVYEYAKEMASRMGYKLNMGSDGHRIGDFPHHPIFRGPIVECLEKLKSDAWILEIQLDHPRLPMSAFHEDILN